VTGDESSKAARQRALSTKHALKAHAFLRRDATLPVPASKGDDAPGGSLTTHDPRSAIHDAGDGPLE